MRSAGLGLRRPSTRLLGRRRGRLGGDVDELGASFGTEVDVRGVAGVDGLPRLGDKSATGPGVRRSSSTEVTVLTRKVVTPAIGRRASRRCGARSELSSAASLCTATTAAAPAAAKAETAAATNIHCPAPARSVLVLISITMASA